jgi:hypothetical protein
VIIKHLSLPIIVMATLLMAQTTQATTYYVDRLPGSDSNNGISEATPFRTIIRCAAVAVAGDTCLVKNGNYPENWVNQFTRSGTPGNPITFKNYPGHSPTVTFPARNDANYYQARLGRDNADTGWLVVEGFNISNGYAGINLINVHDTIVRSNVIHDVYLNGVGGFGRNLTIDKNRIYHNGRFAECAAAVPPGSAPCNLDHGFYLAGSNVTITNNLIYNNLSYGIQIAARTFNTASGHFSAAYVAAQNWLIANNTIAYNNWRSGIVFDDEAADSDLLNIAIKNNILYQNGQMSTCCGNDIHYSSATGTGHAINNNISYATTSTGFTYGTCSGCTMSGNLIGANPNFINAPSTVPASPNFKLNSGSPAIDKGLNQPLIKEDFMGVPRPQGSALDIGAYEATGNTASPAAPVNLKVF